MIESQSSALSASRDTVAATKAAPGGADTPAEGLTTRRSRSLWLV